jgi:hypothetical protein
MKRAGEFVLMDSSRSVHPEQELDVEPRVTVNHEFGLAERRIGLNGLVFAEQEVTHQGRKFHFPGWRLRIQRGTSDVRELRQ